MTKNLSEQIEIIAFMKYLGVTPCIMDASINLMTNGSILEYLNECKNILYDDNMMFIFDNYHKWYLIKENDIGSPPQGTERGKKFLDMIISSHFPINFQTKVIKKIIMANIWTLVDTCFYTENIDIYTIRKIIELECRRFSCLDSKIVFDKFDQRYDQKNERGYYINISEIFERMAEHLTKFIVSLNSL